MGISVQEQLRQLALGLLLGGAVGLGWDVRRTLCRRLPAWMQNSLGLLYLVVTAWILFLSGQAAGGGMRLFFLSACAVGWALYLWGMEGLLASIRRQLNRFFSDLLEKAKNNTKMHSNNKKSVGFFSEKYLCKK